MQIVFHNVLIITQDKFDILSDNLMNRQYPRLVSVIAIDAALKSSRMAATHIPAHFCAQPGVVSSARSDLPDERMVP